MKRAGLSAAVVALSLGACTHYAPAPPRPEQFVAALDARRLDEKPPEAEWTGPDLLSAALVRNPQIIEARAKYVAALAAARAAKAPQGPSLTLTAEYATELPRWGYSAISDIPLDYGARRSVRVTTANLQALQAFYDYGDTIWSVRTDLEKARVDLINARAAIALTSEAVGLRRDRASRVNARVNAGQDARAVALTAQGDVATAERAHTAALEREQAARVDLAKALGVSPQATRNLQLAPLVTTPSLSDLPAWRRDAALSRRDVLRAIADYDIAENALRLQVASQYPAVSLGPSYNYDHGVHKYPMTVGLTLPPWDLNRHAIAQAEAARAAAGRSLELAQANALAAVDAAAAALSAAHNDLERVRAGDLPVAERTAATVARATSAGESDRVDEMAARGAVLDARISLLDAEHTAATATADLEDALRRSFDPAETAVIQAEMTKVGGAR